MRHFFRHRQDQELTLGDEVKRMDLSEGDVLVVKLRKPASAVERDHIYKVLSDMLPGHPIVICGPDADLYTIRSDS